MAKHRNLIGGLSGLALFAGVFVLLVDRAYSNFIYAAMVVGVAAGGYYVVLVRQELQRNLASQTTKYGANAILYSFVVLAILAVVNFITIQNPKRFDLTEEGLFTLSDQTVKALQGLTEPVKVTAFYGASNPEELPIKGQIEEMFESYRYFSEKFEYTFIDPYKDPVAVKAMNITSTGPRIIVQQIDPKAAAAGTGPDNGGDKKGVREARVKDPNEEEMTNALIKVTRKEVKQIYFLSGHGEHGLDDREAEGYASLREALESEGYKASHITLIDKTEVPGDAAMLIVGGPKKPLLAPEIETLEKYLERGGRVFLMADPLVEAGLTALAGKWNIEVGNNLVVDTLSRMFQMGATVPVVQEYGEHAITRGMRAFSLFPTVRSVKSKSGEGGITAMNLASTTQTAWAEADLTSSQASFDAAAGDVRGPIAVAALATKNTENAANKITKEARLIVFGDSDIAGNQFLNTAANRDLVLNTIAWLAEEENLISIRPKQRKASKLFLTETQGNFLTYTSLLFIPAAFLIGGISIFRSRRRK